MITEYHEDKFTEYEPEPASSEFTVKLMPKGLFAAPDAPRMDEKFAAYARTDDQRIARLTGAVFSVDHRTRVLADRSAQINSGPATLAPTAVAMTDPSQELKALHLFQSAHNVQGLDVTDPKEPVRILNASGLAHAAAKLDAPGDSIQSANCERIGVTRRMMQKFQLDGVPGMVIGQGDTAQLLAAQQIFGAGDLTARLNAASPNAYADALI